MALGVSYDGREYHGWQSQPSGKTIQDTIETALSVFVGHRVRTLCAGRTDAGVHALMQVIHFDTQVHRTCSSWVRGSNAKLPSDIAVEWAKEVPESFHCRAAAISRRYTYIVVDSAVRPSQNRGGLGWSFKKLNIEAMQSAATVLIGEHDFSSFRSSACQALTPIKHLMKLSILQRGAFFRFDFEANAFLHHMIRNIMGCLVAIGQEKRDPIWLEEVLQSRNRKIAAPTFAPNGLYFFGPRYAKHWGLPDSTPMFELFSLE